jgi:hypothetical protein
MSKRRDCRRAGSGEPSPDTLLLSPSS